MSKFRPPLWVLVWLALLLLAGVVFLANPVTVERLMDSTGLTALLYPQGRSALVLVHPAPPAPAQVLPVLPTAEPPEVTTPAATVESLGEASVETTSPIPEVVAPAALQDPNTYRLFFTRLGPDGRLETLEWQRELPAGLTPLTATMRALLLGPTLQEKGQGALTMLPAGTKLLSARLQGRIALLSFNEEFTHNTMGNEGLVAQLKQVVWTATQFPTVGAVQILIGGQYRDTLGEEGLSIASPLSRNMLP
jgi:hypothetical protein